MSIFNPPAPEEQLALLNSRNYSIQPVGAAGYTNVWQALQVAWIPVAIFVFSIVLLTATSLRYANETLVTVVYDLAVVAFFAVPVMALALLLFGMLVAAAKSRVRGSAMVFWAWWPFWRVVLCVGAAWVGSWIGNKLWFEQFLPHTELQRFQLYRDLEPTVSGKRLLDAGVVQFDISAGVDRKRTGCIQDGPKYCVAPIVFGKELMLNATDRTQDLFMSGTGCCDCPGEFRCGDWNVPQPLGGLRVLQASRREFFMLAAEKWAASMGRRLQDPIFFEWVADPETAFRELRGRGIRLRALALLCVPLAIVAAVLILNGALALLNQLGCAAPLEGPSMPTSLGRTLGRHLLPKLHQHAEQQEAKRRAAWDPKYVVL